MKLTFPSNFLWGAATSAYQIEGAHDADGKGESIWDRFSHTPGKIDNGETGDTAVDHYHRYPQDVALMKELGLRAYRLSTAWTRILPAGRGEVNQKGLDFYNRLVDSLLAQDIVPFITLYHWDLPQALQDEGGWEVRSTAEAFAEYTHAITRSLGDRVKHWITHNEPAVASFVGHAHGRHAPGKEDLGAAVRASHHILLSHGLALPIIRQNSPGCEAGITLDINFKQAVSPSLVDYRAARVADGIWARWFLHPAIGDGYPPDVEAFFIEQGALPPQGMDAIVQAGDLKVINAPLDFLGINYYRRDLVRADVPEAANLPQTVFPPPKGTDAWSEMNWETYPDGLFYVLARIHFEYQLPKYYITENGASFSDAPGADGRIRDARRLDYLRGHIAAAHRAIQAGVPLAGYFTWSLLDNFEWGYGYAQRFGIVWVDFETQQRTPKDSARWYSQVIADNGLEFPG
jgi:beta-glucosidase